MKLGNWLDFEFGACFYIRVFSFEFIRERR
jgi:hypothetical protein